MPDIFVSYAHVDNLPASGRETETGWVTHLINNLRNEISRKIGRTEAFELWMDYKLKWNDALTPEIERKLGETDALLILLSPGWLASEWCRRELEVFIANKSNNHKGKIFVAELDYVTQRPETIVDLVAYRFWRKNDQDKVRRIAFPIPNPADEKYFDRVIDIASHLAEEIQQQLHRRSSATLNDQKCDYMHSVYVAPVGDSLYEQRNRLISGLNQFGIKCVPSGNRYDPDVLQKSLLTSLLTSPVFIQLLDSDYCMGLPLSTSSFPQGISSSGARNQNPAKNGGG